jgi:hypothetical protein
MTFELSISAMAICRIVTALVGVLFGAGGFAALIDSAGGGKAGPLVMGWVLIIVAAFLIYIAAVA